MKIFLIVLAMMVSLFVSGYITALLLQHTKLNWLKPKAPLPNLELYDHDAEINLTMRGQIIFTGVIKALQVDHSSWSGEDTASIQLVQVQRRI